MNIKQVDFRDVFDGHVNYAPKAIVHFSLERLSANFNFHLVTGTDGLDKFSTLPMVIDVDENRRFRFALWRHDGNPQDTFSINLPLQQVGSHELVSEILNQLDVPNDYIIWQDNEDFDLEQGPPITNNSREPEPR